MRHSVWGFSIIVFLATSAVAGVHRSGMSKFSRQAALKADLHVCVCDETLFGPLHEYCFRAVSFESECSDKVVEAIEAGVEIDEIAAILRSNVMGSSAVEGYRFWLKRQARDLPEPSQSDLKLLEESVTSLARTR